MSTVKVNDIDIYYEIHGDGEPLCLIPGLANDVSDLQVMIRLLSRKYRVIAFDNRGVGRTDKPDIPYSIEMMADDAAGLLKALEIAQAHVLGISMGGRIATALTLGHPELVRSLILVSTFVNRIESSRTGRLLGLMLRILALRILGRRPQPYQSLLRQRDATREYDASDRLGEIDVPTLILHGKRDSIAPFRLAEEMHAAIRGSKMIAFSGGHLFVFMQPRPFVDAVLEFLESPRSLS